MGFKHPYSSLKIKMIKPRPRPPSTELAKQSSSASDGMKHDANSSTVDSSMKPPQRIYTLVLLNSGPILRASATHASISTMAVRSKMSRMETEKAGKPTNDPTKVISIQRGTRPTLETPTGWAPAHPATNGVPSSAPDHRLMASPAPHSAPLHSNCAKRSPITLCNWGYAFM